MNIRRIRGLTPRTLNAMPSCLWKRSAGTVTGSAPQIKTDHSTSPGRTISPALVDSHGRAHTYLRISLTERCNLRCTYCMPAEGVELTAADRLLTADEVVRLAGVFAASGVEKIRLTGGEPTVRRDLAEIVGQLSQLRGIRAVGMTSNGIALSARRLEALVKAGLTHLNLSLDTLDAMRYDILTRRERGFARVMRAIECAERALPTQLKLNCVVIRGINEDEVADFVGMTENRNIDVRFIEYMPFGGNAFDARKLVPYREMLAGICRRFADPLPTRLVDTANSTSKAYQVSGFRGQFGFITSMSEHFCATCNRLRLTADGNLKVCLHGAAEVSLRDHLRACATDAQLLEVIGAALRNKRAQHAGPQLRGESHEDDQPTDDPHRRLTAGLVRLATTSSSTAVYQTLGSTSNPIFSANKTLRQAFIFTATRRAIHTSAAARSDVLSHVDARGAARMVDVTSKPATERVATAAAVVEFAPAVFRPIFGAGGSPKGDIFGAARLAGIQAAKRTADLIPLCHQIPLSHVDVRFLVDEENCQIQIATRVKCRHGTGVEMEALTAGAVAALTIYDMCKALGGASICVADLRLSGKRGGRTAPSGDCAVVTWPPDGYF